jgi:hypothetical protein
MSINRFIKDKMWLGESGNVFYRAHKGQNVARRKWKCPLSGLLRTKRGPEEVEMSFMESIKDNPDVPGSSGNVLHLNDESQNVAGK